jgi:hypothetical protein
MRQITINHAAKGPRGMTVREIEAFVQAVTDHTEIHGWIVQVETTSNATIRSLEVTVDYDKN